MEDFFDINKLSSDIGMSKRGLKQALINSNIKIKDEKIKKSDLFILLHDLLRHYNY